jgi:hypothetical protein
MSITRRQFLLGTGAGLILPSYYDKVFTFFENHGEPLLEIPNQTSSTLYAYAWGDRFEFRLDGLETEIPRGLTRREYADRYFGSMAEYNEAKHYCPNFLNFDEPGSRPCVDLAWSAVGAPAAKAYHLLDGIDLGSAFDGDDPVGHLEFMDGPNPGSNYLGVQTEDPVSVSLVQKRLNDLNFGIRVCVVGE